MRSAPFSRSDFSRSDEHSWVLAVALGCAVPMLIVSALVLAGAGASPIKADAPVVAQSVPVGRGTITGDISVGLKVRRSEPAIVSSPAGGIVTKLGAAPGRTLTGGDTVLWIDDVPRLGMVSDAPLVADVTPGSRGPNVARAQQALRQAGVLHLQPDGKAGRATVAAIRTLNRRLGRPEQGATLSVDSFVWLGPEPFPVERRAVRIGSRVAAGEQLLSGPRAATRIAVAEPERATPAAGDYVVSVGGTAVPYVVGTGVIRRRADVAKLADALGADEGVGTAHLAQPVDVVTVPGSAVVTDETGATCVFASVDGAAVSVAPVGGGTSEVRLPADFPLREVLANPRATRPDPRCG